MMRTGIFLLVLLFYMDIDLLLYKITVWIIVFIIKTAFVFFSDCHISAAFSLRTARLCQRCFRLRIPRFRQACLREGFQAFPLNQ